MPEDGIDYYKEWQKSFLTKLDQPVSLDENQTATISPGEKAVFLAILKGFSQAGDDLDKNSEIVTKAVTQGQLDFWAVQLPITPSDIQQTEFNHPKWRKFAAESMRVMHSKAGANPRSLMFIEPSQFEDTAISMISSIQDKVLNKLNLTKAQI